MAGKAAPFLTTTMYNMLKMVARFSTSIPVMPMHTLNDYAPKPR